MKDRKLNLNRVVDLVVLDVITLSQYVSGLKLREIVKKLEQDQKRKFPFLKPYRRC